MYRGIATFTLDYGKAPRWLFERMVKLGRAMTDVIVDEYGPNEFVARMGDPVWFQSLGTVLAFDWNASGLTTILTAALKEAIRGREHELGIFICGGKGKTSRKTPSEIQAWGSRLSLPDNQVQNLEYNSRMSAKVDSALIQDSYQIYHHSFMFSRNGAWTVVQQGMNTANQTARRYHWHSASVKDLIVEPHSGIASLPGRQAGQAFGKSVLNMSAAKSAPSRDLSVAMIKQSQSRLLKDLELLDRYMGPYNQTVKIRSRASGDQLTLANLEPVEFKHHPVEGENFSKSPYLQKILQQLSEEEPENYEQLLAKPGVGPKTIRALALTGEVLYGAKPSYRDPARYSFAHGGKDATPYPVDRVTYDQTIQTFQQLVNKARLQPQIKNRTLRRLAES